MASRKQAIVPLIGLALFAPLSLTQTGCAGNSVLRDHASLANEPSGGNRSDSVVLQSGHWGSSTPAAAGTPAGDTAIADALFRQDQAELALEGFREILDKHKDNYSTTEYAKFMIAECHFRMEAYKEAADSYEIYLEEHQGGKHTTYAVKRIYAIADIWLDDARADVREGTPSSFPRRIINVEDGKPYFDIDGHAIRLLERVREIEPNGPLADDSLMMAAGYFYSQGNYESSVMLYDQLIHSYPKSDHLAQAHVLHADAQLQSYKGTSYDGRKLEESKRMLQSAVRQFPDKLDEDRTRIYHKLDSIEQEKARREFEVAEWYERMGKTESARYYYTLVSKRHSDTKWAERAQERLRGLINETPDLEVEQSEVAEKKGGWFNWF